MKWNKVFFVVATLAFLSVLEVKSEAKISDLRPNEAEQNFVNIKKTMEISNSDKKKLKRVVTDDQLELGSGILDDDYFDDDDYLDEDDDDDYYDDDDDDEYDYEEGSGSPFELELEDDYDNDIDLIEKPGGHVKVIPDETNDFHFEEEKNRVRTVKKNKKKPVDGDENLLYEYYNELIYGDDDDDMDYLYEVEKDLKGGEEIVEITKVWNEVDSDLESSNFPAIFTQHSYIFLMLSSALIR
jgi:hypothetical protein